LFKHPFIVIGLRNTLQQLRDLGFITFNDVIDERYDAMSFARHRFELATAEIKKLNSYNIHELRDLYNELQPILNYNREHYLRLFNQKQPVELIHRIKKFVND